MWYPPLIGIPVYGSAQPMINMCPKQPSLHHPKKSQVDILKVLLLLVMIEIKKIKGEGLLLRKLRRAHDVSKKSMIAGRDNIEKT